MTAPYPLGTVKPKRTRRTRNADGKLCRPRTLPPAPAPLGVPPLPEPEAGEVLTTAQVARLLQMSESAVHRLRGEGLPGRKAGKGYRYPWPAVLAWLEGER